LAKPGLDGHDRGVKVLAHAMRDAGMEVIYTGLRQPAAAIVAMAVQEDVDIICVSILSGAHNILFEQIMASLKDAGALDIPVLGGGVIPQQDIVTLKEMGVREIFTPGARLDEITDYIENLVWPDDEA
ncbi:MAG: cobalamin B12-binding domain-containing protein, partial [Rhodospirillaceae bacterium]|nr:cobalamin B12-binding domain-containing protein [Rhodospirillaceae bacterium]